MKKCISVFVSFLFAGVVFAAYQIYSYQQTTTINENIVIDDSNKIILPDTMGVGDQFCGSWNITNNGNTQNITVKTQISEGLSGDFTVDGNTFDGSVVVEIRYHIGTVVHGCLTVKNDANGEQSFSIDVSR